MLEELLATLYLTQFGLSKLCWRNYERFMCSVTERLKKSDLIDPHESYLKVAQKLPGLGLPGAMSGSCAHRQVLGDQANHISTSWA